MGPARSESSIMCGGMGESGDKTVRVWTRRERQRQYLLVAKLPGAVALMRPQSLALRMVYYVPCPLYDQNSHQVPPIMVVPHRSLQYRTLPAILSLDPLVRPSVH